MSGQSLERDGHPAVSSPQLSELVRDRETDGTGWEEDIRASI